MYKNLYSLFPRQIGIPYRITCNNASDFYHTINEYKFTKRVYASVYNYISNPEYINNFLMVDKVYFDFDGLTDDVRNEVARFSNSLHDEDIKHLVVFSGGGFHLYLWTKNYAELDNKKSSLYNIHRHFINTYNLKHVDPAIIGDIARVATVPNSYNFKRQSFAIPIATDEIGTIVPTNTSRLKYKNLIFGNQLFDVYEFNSHELYYNYMVSDLIPDNNIKIDIDIYETLPQCMKKILQTGKSGKYVGTYNRMQLIIYLRDNGIPIGNIEELISQYLLGKRGGVIEWQHCLREHQIEFVFTKSTQYGFPDCGILKQKNMCPISGHCDKVKEYGDGKMVLKCYK